MSRHPVHPDHSWWDLNGPVVLVVLAALAAVLTMLFT